MSQRMIICQKEKNTDNQETKPKDALPPWSSSEIHAYNIESG